MSSIIRNSIGASLRRHVSPAPRHQITRRSMQTTMIRRQQDKKDDLMDKDSMNTTSTEYSKSGGDGQAAQDSDAFDPSSTRPEQTKAGGSEGAGEGSDALNASPGNHEISKPSEDLGEGTGQSPSQASGSRGKQSGGGSPQKGGGDKSG